MLYISDHKYILDKVSKHRRLIREMAIYKQTRIGYIIFEILFFLICNLFIIYLCIQIIYALS